MTREETYRENNGIKHSAATGAGRGAQKHGVAGGAKSRRRRNIEAPQAAGINRNAHGVWHGAAGEENQAARIATKAARISGSKSTTK